jgi:hypothetical protein
MSSTSDSALPQDLIDLLKSADVTTITDDSKTLAIYMFNQFTPSVVSGIQDNVQTGIDAIEPNITTLNQVVAGVDQSVNVLTEMQNYLETLPESDFGTKDLTELITTEIYNQIPGSLLTTLSGIKTLAELNDILVVKLEQKTSLDTAIAEMEDLVFKMNALKDDVPVAFESAKTDYLSQIEDLRVQIEDVFQSTLNGGFRNIYLTTMSAAILGLGIISLYKPVKHSKSEEKS